MMIEGGLVSYSEKAGSYDRFWNRVMFPIMDTGNRVIGFGGRVMGDGEPKYLNSPETMIFNKRKNLFGLNFAKKTKYDYIILDTAPVGLVTDTLQIGKVADVTVFVCRADYTPKSSFGLVNSLSAEKKMPNMCVIINGIDMSKKKYGYYYGYGKYGKYGRYGSYGRYSSYGSYGYGNYGNYGNYAESHYGDKGDNSIKLKRKG